MKSKNLIILIVLAIVGVIAWAMLNSSGNSSTESPEPNSSQDNTESAPNEGNDVVIEEVPNAFRGELKASNDKKRGNLMLLLDDSDRIIYLNTSRDYSSLIGKKVIVDIEGSLDDFRLVDIKPQ